MHTITLSVLTVVRDHVFIRFKNFMESLTQKHVTRKMVSIMTTGHT